MFIELNRCAKLDGELASQSMQSHLSILALRSGFTCTSDIFGWQKFDRSASFDFVSVLSARAACARKAPTTFGLKVLLAPSAGMKAVRILSRCIARLLAFRHGFTFPNIRMASNGSSIGRSVSAIQPCPKAQGNQKHPGRWTFQLKRYGVR